MLHSGASEVTFLNFSPASNNTKQWEQKLHIMILTLQKKKSLPVHMLHNKQSHFALVRITVAVPFCLDFRRKIVHLGSHAGLHH